ncbi:unnamed protein product, partial [Prunus brigantina]
MKKSFQLRQSSRPLSTYFIEMNCLFMELDYRCPTDLKNPYDIAKLKKRTSEERVFMFLAGSITILTKCVVACWLLYLFPILLR